MRSVRRDEGERLGRLEARRLVAREIGVPVKPELAPAGAFAEVELHEVRPDVAGAVRVLVAVEPALLVGDRQPQRAGDVGLAGDRDPDRHADVAHDAEDGRHCAARVRPAWCSVGIPMICSSLNLLRLIVRRLCRGTD
jgi:hypothetical protein